jgi:hypothetical protein
VWSFAPQFSVPTLSAGALTANLEATKAQCASVRAFWSMTMYDPNFFFVANPITP